MLSFILCTQSFYWPKNSQDEASSKKDNSLGIVLDVGPSTSSKVNQRLSSLAAPNPLACPCCSFNFCDSPKKLKYKNATYKVSIELIC